MPAVLSQQPLHAGAGARRRMRRSTTVAVGGVVASLSLAVALTVMVTSFRGSMMEWLDAVLPAPLYVRAAGRLQPCRSGVAARRCRAAHCPALPGDERAQAMRSSQLVLSPERPAISILVRAQGRCGAATALGQRPRQLRPGHSRAYQRGGGAYAWTPARRCTTSAFKGF